MWRIIVEQRATLHEIETYWSINDVFDANDALDAWHDAERRASQRAAR